MVFRAYNDGIAFRYFITGEDGTTETVENEASEFVLPYQDTKLWMGGTSNTYEVDYSNISMKALTASSGKYTIPATAGFQLAQAAVYESGTVNFASSIYAYEGTAALGFLNQAESSFEKSLLVDEKMRHWVRTWQ